MVVVVEVWVVAGEYCIGVAGDGVMCWSFERLSYGVTWFDVA